MENSPGPSSKANPDPHHAPVSYAAPWEKPSTSNQQSEPAPPPIWTRYIDSRLKQFCTR